MRTFIIAFLALTSVASAQTEYDITSSEWPARTYMAHRDTVAYADITQFYGVGYVIRERMQNLEERLDPARFFRIHRSTIVQLDRVEALLTASGGDYAVRLSDGKRLRVSRGRRDELARRLGLDGLD